VRKVVKVINGKRYDTDTARLVAHDQMFPVWYRAARCTYLYVTKKGNFFLYKISPVQGELPEDIIPIATDEAKKWYGELPFAELDYEDAFHEEPEDA